MVMTIKERIELQRKTTAESKALLEEEPADEGGVSLSALLSMTVEDFRNCGKFQLREVARTLTLRSESSFAVIDNDVDSMARQIYDMVNHPAHYLGCYRRVHRADLERLHVQHLFNIAQAACASLIISKLWHGLPHGEQVSKTIQFLSSYAESHAAPAAAPAEDKDAVLQVHIHWMRPLVEQFPYVTYIGKRRNVRVSPKTFMFVVEGNSARCTWMADPATDKIVRRFKFEDHRWEYLQHGWQAACGLIFTRDEILAYGKQEEVKVEEALQPVVECNLCACGADLSCNKNYPGEKAGDPKICGECQIKLAGDWAWEGVYVGPKALPVRVPKKVHNPKYDPRPGIDDQGAWSTPSWDDL